MRNLGLQIRGEHALLGGGDDPQTARAECARLLRLAADSLDAGYGLGTLRDVNGNAVGSWMLAEWSGPLPLPGDPEGSSTATVLGRIPE